jgi:hypothetical protein
VDEALGTARRHFAAHPEDPKTAALLGEALFRAGALTEAEALLDGRAELPARGWMTLGRLRDARGRTREAIELMDRAVAAAPSDLDVLYRAASVTATRAVAVERLEAYVGLAKESEDPDRVEAARGSARVLRALGERAVWIARARPERVEIPLRRLWDADTGVTVGFVVEVELGDANGTKPVRLLLDTGSPGLYVIDRIARKRGFEPLATRESYGGGGDQRHETTRGFFPSFRIGGLAFDDALATTGGGEADPLGRYHGYLGIAPFGGYRVVIDLGAGRLILEPAGIGSGEPYWDVDGQLLVTAAEKSSGRTGLFLLDTGATGTIVARSFADAHPAAHAGPEAEVRGFGGRIEGVRALRGLEIAWGELVAGGELRVSDFSLRSRLLGVEVAGYLGLDLFGDSRIVIDTVARTVEARRAAEIPQREPSRSSSRRGSGQDGASIAARSKSRAAPARSPRRARNRPRSTSAPGLGSPTSTASVCSRSASSGRPRSSYTRARRDRVRRARSGERSTSSARA